MPRDVGRQLVCSNRLSALGYDAEEKCLQIEYRNGAVYEAHNFEKACFEAALDRGDIDRVLTNLLRDYRFEYVGRVFPLW